jgi:protein SCO1
MRRHRKALLLGAALAAPIAAFGLPILAVILLGPQRSEAVAGWLTRNAQQRHEHSHPAGRVVPAFSLVDQQDRTLTRDDLKGQVWVASFFLSRCAGTCPMTSAKMAQLQQRVTAPGVKLVSFSMDPANDTPQVLKEYASRFSADGERWHMLTGDGREITAVVAGLGLAEKQGQQPRDMIHSDRFVLVDATGRTRGFYDSGSAGDMEHLAADAMALAGAR